MDEEIEIINTNTRVEKLKNFLTSKRKQLITLLILIILILITFFGYQEFKSSSKEKLANKLTNMTFANKVFFCNSGAEAVEAAIKIARAYHQIEKKKNRFKIITIKGSFHGRTIATISASGQKKLVDGFKPLVDGFTQVDFGDHDSFEKLIDKKTAAIMIEPI